MIRLLPRLTINNNGSLGVSGSDSHDRTADCSTYTCTDTDVCICNGICTCEDIGHSNSRDRNTGACNGVGRSNHVCCDACGSQMSIRGRSIHHQA